jgi:hypothetical protein
MRGQYQKMSTEGCLEGRNPKDAPKAFRQAEEESAVLEELASKIKIAS